MSGTIRVLGLPGCVRGVGAVRLEGALGGAQARAQANGSFVLAEVPVQSDELLAIRFESSEPTPYAVVTLEIAPAPPPQPHTVSPHAISGVPPVSAAAGGLVVVRGLCGSEAPGETVIVQNQRTAELVTAVTDAQGRFQVELAAQPGDRLQILDDGEPLSGFFWEVVVP